MALAAEDALNVPQGKWDCIRESSNTRGVNCVLPLDVDSINENDSVANPDPTPRIASVHKSWFAEVVLVGCWMEAVYYCLLLRKR